ncbi:MAG: 16S rRNA (guanine(966)-N(2))-methyltransferase RsmD [Candidatus Omnitrophica bacterium]|nr:16S rRNA (guanine(966)-N(2))-methyltransferase RsmD [Candidatus Omnitrophota bacterium]
MRIIAGRFRSRRIESPKGVTIRPTSDRVKESLFGILGPFVMGKNCLDLFGGTGNLGLEALSRGARSCTFIDNNPRCVSIIRKNAESLGVTKEANINLADAIRYVKKTAKEGLVFDLIFLDPPYHKGIVKKSLILLDDYNIISKLSIIVAEHHREDELPPADELRKLTMFRQEKYGGTFLSFYREV